MTYRGWMAAGCVAVAALSGCAGPVPEAQTLAAWLPQPVGDLTVQGARPDARAALVPAPAPTDATAFVPGGAVPAGTGRIGADPDWWLDAGDPLLAVLVRDAQRASGDLAAAGARVAQARAQWVAAASGGWPQLSAQGEAARGKPDLLNPLGTRHGVGLVAAWELDLFGGVAAGVDAGRARERVAEAGQRAAAVSVAAETAWAYTGWQACHLRQALLQQRLDSQRRSRDLLAGGVRAGLLPDQSLASAELATAHEQAAVLAEAARCDGLLQALVALSARSEAALRPRLAQAAQAPLGLAQQLPLPGALPAQWLHQRPDLAAAAASVGAAAADERQALARAWPRITLGGNLSASVLSTTSELGGTRSGQVWALGPLQVSLPLFDAGARRADRESARRAYEAALVQYEDRLRHAVREVRQALLQWQGSQEAAAALLPALQRQQQQLAQARLRWRSGLASRLEPDEAERGLLALQLALLDQRARGVQGWIGLYRALGGGWSAQGLAG